MPTMPMILLRPMKLCLIAPHKRETCAIGIILLSTKKESLAAQFEHQIAQYDEAIRYVDDQLARLDAKLREAGRKVRWVITSDHGEEFGERGSWGHAHTLYAEQLRIPLILSVPVFARVR